MRPCRSESTVLRGSLASIRLSGAAFVSADEHKSGVGRGIPFISSFYQPEPALRRQDFLLSSEDLRPFRNG